MTVEDRISGLDGSAHLGEAAFGSVFGDGSAEKFLEVHFLDKFGGELFDERAGLAGNGAAEFRPGAAMRQDKGSHRAGDRDVEQTALFVESAFGFRAVV